jgi:hypothetical protein
MIFGELTVATPRERSHQPNLRSTLDAIEAFDAGYAAKTKLTSNWLRSSI